MIVYAYSDPRLVERAAELLRAHPFDPSAPIYFVFTFSARDLGRVQAVIEDHLVVCRARVVLAGSAVIAFSLSHAHLVL